VGWLDDDLADEWVKRRIARKEDKAMNATYAFSLRYQIHRCVAGSC
jgi:hypothetical protein